MGVCCVICCGESGGMVGVGYWVDCGVEGVVV